MKKGFTLVELAIVIVIIGLIIGAILAGQDLIENSDRQGVIKEFQKYNNAATNFKQQFNALTGDMSNASTYWSGCANNGDGNGYLDQGAEWGGYWALHLKCSEMLNINHEEYVKSGLKGGYYIMASTFNSPDNAVAGIGSDITIYEKKGNYIFLVGTAAPDMGSSINGILAPEAAKFIDTKMDDGKASSGNLVSITEYKSGSYSNNGCTDHGSAFIDNGTEGLMNYTLTSKTKSCRLIYWLHHLD